LQDRFVAGSDARVDDANRALFYLWVSNQVERADHALLRPLLRFALSCCCFLLFRFLSLLLNSSFF
jgi:hypothetical protein